MYSAYRYSVARGNAPDPVVGPDPWLGLPEIDVGGTSRFIYTTTTDNPLIMRFSYDGINFGDDIEISQDDPPELWYYSAQKAQVRNVVAGNIAVYQLTFMW